MASKGVKKSKKQRGLESSKIIYFPTCLGDLESMLDTVGSERGKRKEGDIHSDQTYQLNDEIRNLRAT